MALIGFARVSTKEQELAIQLSALLEAGCEEIFYGKQSGVSDDNEKKLEELIKYIRKDDIVLVTKLDRLGRSLKSILQAIDDIHSKKATLRSLDGVIDTSNKSPFARATLNLIAVFAQLDRDLIISRTQEGRDAAIASGKKMGRKFQIPEEERVKIRKKLKTKSVSAVAKEYQVSRTTIQRIRDES